MAMPGWATPKYWYDWFGIGHKVNESWIAMWGAVATALYLVWDKVEKILWKGFDYVIWKIGDWFRPEIEAINDWLPRPSELGRFGQWFVGLLELIEPWFPAWYAFTCIGVVLGFFAVKWNLKLIRLAYGCVKYWIPGS